MPEQVTNYQCPACGGPLHFDEKSGKQVCDYCGSSYTIEEIEKLYASKDEAAAQNMAESNWDESELKEQWGKDAEGMRVYTCPSCGAQLIADATTAATSCPYCSNPTIIPGQFAGGLKPDYVIPFKLDKKQAESALRSHYKGRPFLPKAFTRQSQIEKIQGVYAPFWLFDGKASGSVQYQAEQIRRYTRGDQEITETRHYAVMRSGELQFEKIPVDSSKKMDDAYMESIEPYSYDELKPFSMAYLPGYLADKYDVSEQECGKRADQRSRQSFKNELSKTVRGYTSCREIHENIQMERGKVHYALFPVWVLNTKWNGKDYLFMMNGQSGKMTGDLPISKGKMWGTFASITAVLTIILTLIRSL